MKNQYFADFGDYQKFSLIQVLKKNFPMLVFWLKTPDDSRTDGKHVSYLEKPAMYRTYNADMFDFLKSALQKGRDLKIYQRSVFAHGVEFVDNDITNTALRAKSVASIIANAAAQVVLCDPDNGFEVASATTATLHKYVTYDEVASIYESGKSVIVYQHYPRIARTTFVDTCLDKIRERIPADVLFAITVRHSVYLFICHTSHTQQLLRCAREYVDGWKELKVTLVQKA